MGWRDRAQKVEGQKSGGWRDRAQSAEGEFTQAQEPQRTGTTGSDIVEEQHPAVSDFLRGKEKFLGGDKVKVVKDALGPDFEVIERDGRVLVKGKGEKSYRTTDPAVGWDSSKNVIDNLYDVSTELRKDVILDNLYEGLQGFLGGPGTSAIRGGLGALGANAIQQGAGNLAGSQEGVNPLSAVIETGLGATAPLLPAATKAVASKVGAPLAELMSGVPKEATRTLIERGKGPVLGGRARDKMQLLQTETKAAFGQAKGEAGQGMEAALRDVGGIDLTEAESVLRQRLSEVEALAAEGGGTPVFQQEAAAIRRTLEDFFPRPDDTAMRRTYDEMLDEGRHLREILRETYAAATPSQRDILHEGGYGQKAWEAVQEGAELVNRGPPRPEASGTYAWNLARRLDELNAAYKQGGVSPGVGLGEKQLVKPLSDASESIIQQLREKSPDFARANDRYAQVKQLESPVGAFLQSPNPRLATVGGAMKDAGETQLDLFTDIDKAVGSNLVQGAEDIHARQFFQNPGVLPISSKGTVSTGRIGALLGLGGAGGYLAGNSPESALLGGALSVGAGPWALKQYILKSQALAPLIRSAWLPLGSNINQELQQP